MKGKITLIQILLLLVLIIVSVNLFKKCDNNNDDAKDFNRIKSELYAENQSQTESSQSGSERAENGMLLKFGKLYQKNNDFVGWVKIDDTGIDYPVMQNRQSNAYYLNRDFDRKISDSGIPFLDYQCKIKPQSNNCVIYAHNMRNGTMFHDLLNYKDQSFYNDHREISFDTLYDEGVYEIYAVIRTKVGSADEFKYYNMIDLSTKEEYEGYVNEAKERSLYDIEITPQYPDKLLTLSTCSYNTDNERFVIFAKRK